ncbi:hypothetical protein Hanom_Chr09g00864741 [Helianthus anomalus]
MDRLGRSIGQLVRSNGLFVRFESPFEHSHSIGRQARSVGPFEWIISSFNEKDVFVYDGLNF